MKSTLIATLIASAAGTAAWLFGLSQTIWPSHPMIVTFILTIAAYAAARRWARPGMAP